MKHLLILLVLLTGLQSCREDVNTNTDPVTVFESLWTILDEKYCFFEAKNVDWDKIHDQYASRIDTLDDDPSKLFYILGDMMCELKDGHVNLYAAQDMVRYWSWFEKYKLNYNPLLEPIYLGTDYKISSGLKYRILDDNIGYITYRSFSSSISESGLDYIFDYFADCKGLILDVRNNSGGNLSNVNILVSRFTDKKYISSYIRHKTGPAHQEFSDYFPVYVEPSPRKRYTQKKVVVLSNRACYSATNTFICAMKELPNITIMGDSTGGGGGFPISSTLPNGWIVRFSTSPTYDREFKLIEEGIKPDVVVSLDEFDEAKKIDTIIEAARSFIKH